MSYKEFAFRFERDGRTYEIDRGEVGPALAALEIAKAYVIFFLAHECEVAKDGNYEWARTLSNIEDEDFDNLSAEQTAALDHLVGFFKTGSLFSTIKPAYQTAYTSIPAILDSAISHTQEGFRYGISESKMGLLTQSNDIYVVGDGVKADVTAKSLQDAIDYLERARKYLRGPVTVAYNKGKDTLIFDVTRFFSIVDGYQDLLPYHTINPYSTWNDPMVIDTILYGDEIEEIRYYYKGPITFTDASGAPTFGETMTKEIKTLVDSHGIASLANKIIFPDPTFGGIFPDMTQEKLWTTIASLETIEARGLVCEEYTYTNYYGDIRTYEECYKELPNNPSDLDLLNYYLD